MVIKTMDENAELIISSRSSYSGYSHELTPVQMDHCYAKPSNSRQDLTHCKPVRTLFADEPLSNNEFIDVEACVPQKTNPLLDREATKTNYQSAEELVNSISVEETSDDWEENVRREGWTTLQHRIFNKLVKLLVADNMSRLATEKLENEAIQKKILIEGAAKKLRIILASVAWDLNITQWLHVTLMEQLSRDYLIRYISILQVLRSKVPALVDRILTAPLLNTKLVALNGLIINYVANKPWEPALVPTTPSVSKLPMLPFIILVPSGTSNYNAPFSEGGSKRFQSWYNLFQSLGRVMTVTLSCNPPPHTLPMPVFVESLINATVQRVQDLKAGFPGRPIVLVGIQQGGLIAAQVAHIEPVSALVYLGFPLFCVDGKRGEPDDFILDIRSPAMFVIGKSATTSSVDGIEQMRHRMKAESTLIVIDGALDSLRMLKWKKKQQNTTQSVVDACIRDEISNFLTAVLSSPPGPVPEKKNAVEQRKPTDTSPVNPAAQVKRPRHSNEADDSGHPALSGHNYSQSTPFAPPWKGRSGTGLARVRGGRVGAAQSRTPYQRTLSEALSPVPRSRIGRSVSTGGAHQRPADHLASRPPLPKGLSSVRSCPSQLDGEADSKSSVSSSQGSPKDDCVHQPMECKGGGDSSETESAPPADDDEEIMEDLRFCSEFMNKTTKTDDSTNEDDTLKNSEDEADLSLAEVCKRLNAANTKNPPPAE